MNANANATAQIVQPQLPPLPECVALLCNDGVWQTWDCGTTDEMKSGTGGDDLPVALITITPPQTPASEEEIRDLYSRKGYRGYMGAFLAGYRLAEERLGVRT